MLLEMQMPKIKEDRADMYEIVEDGVEGKRIPNGLKMIFVAIATNWNFSRKPLAERKNGLRSYQQFADEVRPIYDIICRKYGVEPNVDLKQRLERINRNELEPKFIDIRLYADFIGIPAGILLLLSQYVGAEIQNRENIKFVIKGIMQKINGIYSKIEDSVNEGINLTVSDGDDGLIFDIDKLEKILYSVFDKPKYLK
jgi:hypothetical protein